MFFKPYFLFFPFFLIANCSRREDWTLLFYYSSPPRFSSLLFFLSFQGYAGPNESHDARYKIWRTFYVYGLA